MNHELLKRIILEQHEVIRRTKIIPRSVKLCPEINQVVTGIRRAGKCSMPYPAEELPCHEATVCQNQTSDKGIPAIYLN